MKLIDEYLKDIEKELKKQKSKIKAEEFGLVVEVKDGVVILEGLDNVTFGELVEFESKVTGYVVDLSEDQVGVVVLGSYLNIRAGSKAIALGISLSIPVSDSIIGRVVDSLGNPLDGKGKIKSDKNELIVKLKKTAKIIDIINDLKV